MIKDNYIFSIKHHATSYFTIDIEEIGSFDIVFTFTKNRPLKRMANNKWTHTLEFVTPLSLDEHP